ncbi:hypothetical protein BU23DRAFT_599181 [Bimuria novae-zelandiae CBS 107.79]|uniref:Uncharacterized protein n=1 Tax=Bimuria novae-zelandiae CBS 107.79 TaxID=1447943 RepID=A0A6A5V7W3_9PLEO|nr:hypothetical protein BU23DRAFT_599181 [Bimuria novae-zelandiae CBS 107.79]
MDRSSGTGVSMLAYEIGCSKYPYPPTGVPPYVVKRELVRPTRSSSPMHDGHNMTDNTAVNQSAVYSNDIGPASIFAEIIHISNSAILTSRDEVKQGDRKVECPSRKRKPFPSSLTVTTTTKRLKGSEPWTRDCESPTLESVKTKPISFFSLAREIRDDICHYFWSATTVCFLHDGVAVVAGYNGEES